MRGITFQQERLSRRNLSVIAVIGAIGIVAPFIFPEFTKQISLLWVMVVLSYTWDTMGGQMGYNSFGNVVLFGVGMYLCAGIQVGLYTDLGAYNAARGADTLKLTFGQYYTGLLLGLAAAAVAGFVVAFILGSGILGLRGHYFAIGTLALGIAVGEIASGTPLIGAGSGMTVPQFPGATRTLSLELYFGALVLAGLTFFGLRWLYQTRFGLALNAIRDDEDKAEAMGLRTTRYKSMGWAISGIFLGVCGGLVGNLQNFIDPRETAFAGPTYGVWMVLMVVLGGKGTFWGPMIGAVLFHFTKELFWSYLLGLQNIALGLLVVVIVVFFPEGIVGWFRQHYPHWFGETVDPSTTPDDDEAADDKAVGAAQ